MGVVYTWAGLLATPFPSRRSYARCGNGDTEMSRQNSAENWVTLGSAGRVEEVQENPRRTGDVAVTPAAQ